MSDQLNCWHRSSSSSPHTINRCSPEQNCWDAWFFVNCNFCAYRSVHHLTQGPVSPVLSPGAQPTVGVGSVYGVTQLSSSAPAFAGPYPSFTSSGGPSSSGQKEKLFPERPGEPACQYYLKTGDCKFGSSCRYHHPPDWVISKTNCVLSPLGLPLRPVCFCTCLIVLSLHLWFDVNEKYNGTC